MPLISICIPAYKNIEFLKRLLDSISIQTFTDFEVVITDDSPDESLRELIKEYEAQFKLVYYKNPTPLGTPANWNFAISKATGEWIKIMHDDDWFAEKNSLEKFTSKTSAGFRFIKCAYKNVYANGKTEIIFMSQIWRKRILKQPMSLIANNIIGPPSVTLVHTSIKEFYDERLKWRVDQEYYIRLLKSENNFLYINEPLINVSINEEQVTNSCFNNPSVELPEGLILLEKHGIKALKNIWVYDAWWRLLRNMNIRSAEQLSYFTNSVWPYAISKMVNHIKKTPANFLEIGLFSKICMSLSFFLNFQNLKKPIP